MTKKELQKFLDQHPVKQYSAARLEYSLYYHPEMIDMAKDTFHYVASDMDVIQEAQVRGADLTQMMSLMRKRMSADNRNLLLQRILEHEEELLPQIQKRCMTSMQDEFTENALRFFLIAKGDHTDWIMENYRGFRSEYLRSMLCLVLGIRGKEEYLPFLMQETVRFEQSHPEEPFDQGPLLAVNELGIRFFGLEDDDTSGN